MADSNHKPALLTLPRELRDMIWTFSCSDVIVSLKKPCAPASHTSPITLDRLAQDFSRLNLQDRKPSSTICVSNAGILATCKQMREEALKIYCTCTTFVFDYDTNHFDGITDALEHVDVWRRRQHRDMRRQIKKVRVVYHWPRFKCSCPGCSEYFSADDLIYVRRDRRRMKSKRSTFARSLEPLEIDLVWSADVAARTE